MNATPNALDNETYIALTTYRKNGTPVVTPLWFAADNAKLYAYTEANSGKVKRIRATSKVEVAACTMRGAVTGPAFPATATLLDASKGPYVHGMLNRKYTWKKRLIELGGSIGKIFKKDKGGDAFIEIILT